MKTKKKKKINIPEKLHSVYKTVELPLKSLRSERTKTDEKDKKTHSNNREAVDIDSDDSIGSASDLKADEDRTEVLAKEDAISESIQTCGSSAYHAECESMATREEEYFKKPRHQQRKKVENDQQQTEDMMFVGHKYGDKPLLMDDELDSDCDSKFEKWKKLPEKNINLNDKWYRPSSSVEENKDVFALAPFEKPRTKNKNIKTNNDNQQNIVFPNDLDSPQHFVMESFANFPPYQETENSLGSRPSSISLNPFLIDDVPPNIPTPKSIDTNRQSFIKIPIETKFQANFSDQEFTCDFSKPPRDSILNDNKYYSGDVRPERRVEHSLPDLFAQDNVLPEFTKENSNHFEQSDKSHEKNQKSKKDKKRDKYQLIDDLSLDKSEASTAKPVKVSRNTHSYKKVNIKQKKSSLKLKVDGGFSNMSFEDFPVDERHVIESSIMPYEVLRSPQQEEKKFGSKRIGNPFS